MKIGRRSANPPMELLWKNIPEEKAGDYDFLLEVIDWELNLDPFFAQNRKMLPVPAYYS